MIRRFWIPAAVIGGILGMESPAQTPPTAPPAATPPAAPPPAAKPNDSLKPLSKEEQDARAAFLKGDFEKAIEEFKKAEKNNPLLPPAKVMLANLFYEAGKGEQTRRLIEAAAAEPETAGHPDIFLANGNYAFREGRVTDTVLNLQLVLQLADNPRFNAEQRARFIREARTGLVFSFEARQNYNASKEHLSALLSVDPKNSQFRFRLAVANFNLGATETAFADLAQAYKDDPLLNPPELQMGLLWANRGDETKADEWFKKAVTTHATDSRCHREYAAWLLNTGKTESAKPYLESAERINAASRETQYVRGMYYRYLKQFGEAEKIFEVLSRESPNDILSASNLAICLCESADDKKKKRGVELAESILQRTPKAAEAYALLGWCYYKSGRIEDADKALGQSLSGGQATLDMAYYAARVLADKGKIEDAHKLLKATSAGKGPFVYRSDALALYNDLETKVPKKEEPKKP